MHSSQYIETVRKGKKKMTDYTLTQNDKTTIAYTWNKGTQNLCVLYLHGWTAMRKRKKGIAVAEIAEKMGVHYLSLDYIGHGESSGSLADFTVGKAIQNTQNVLDATVQEMPLIIVGNSIGGWVGLWLMKHLKNIVGFIGLAPAPDITEFVWDKLIPLPIKQAILAGQTIGPNEQTQGFAFTNALFHDGKEHFVLNNPIPFNGPVVLIKGDQDNRVEIDRIYSIKDRLTSNNVIITLIKGANHHLSEPRDIRIIQNEVQQMIGEYYENTTKV